MIPTRPTVTAPGPPGSSGGSCGPISAGCSPSTPPIPSGSPLICLRDRDLVLVDRLFPVLAVTSLAIPFAVGWILYGTLAGAFGVFLWAGLVRMAVLHHVTWSINSVCHIWGSRPFVTSDRSTNFAPLAVLSFGESWHNFHHSAPASARHGALPHQLDPAARLIRIFEAAGWATKVRWPTPAQIASLTVTDVARPGLVSELELTDPDEDPVPAGMS